LNDADPFLNLLISFPYWDNDNERLLRANAACVRLVVDSGAFTGWKGGDPVKLDDYCHFLSNLPIKPWRYFVLDVVHNPEATYENYRIMLDRGLKPVPIFTRGESPDRLDQYYATSDVVGVGGLVGTPKKLAFINGIMKLIAGRRVHWLGVTTPSFLHHYRPYMCDSQSWESIGRYAIGKVYVGRGQFRTVSRDDFRQPPDGQLIAALRSYGLPAAALAKEEGWRGGRSVARRLHARSWVRYSLDLQRQCGTLLFMAFTTAMAAGHLVAGFNDERTGNPLRWR